MTALAPSVGKTCPAGRHVMEPDWTDCHYCRSESAPAGPGSGYVRRPTVVEGAALSMPGPAQGAAPGPHGTVPLTSYPDDKPIPPRPALKPFKPLAVPPPPPLSRPATTPQSATPQNAAPAGPVQRKTIYRPEGSVGPDALQSPPVLTQRRIVGVLVTYSWKTDGEIFPVREGRNLIGRDPECDICIAMDQTMSGRNSHITFRTAFVVGDLVSMKGTDLNGEPIEQQFLSLPNYAVIRAGSTQFTFIAIQPPQANP